MFAQIVTLLNGLAWPIIVGGALWWFRGPITTVMSARQIKLGPQGLELNILSQQLSEGQKTDQGLVPKSSPEVSAEQSPVAKLYAPAYHDLMEETRQKFERDIPAYLARFGGNKEEALKRAAIDYQAAVYLERASRYIFGSQIDVLNFLAANGGRSPKDQLLQFYNSATVVYPALYTAFSFDQWLAFLTHWNLITVEGENVISTAAGKAIVPYMYNWGYLAARPPG
jgi:hypothetical protein